jgi:hypothetical protein
VAVVVGLEGTPPDDGGTIRDHFEIIPLRRRGTKKSVGNWEIFGVPDARARMLRRAEQVSLTRQWTP